MHNWWDAVKQLSAAHRFVDHQPETPRYARARQKLPYLIREGVYLGCSHREPSDDRVEIAVWAPPAEGKGPGYYLLPVVFGGRYGDVRFPVLLLRWDRVFTKSEKPARSRGIRTGEPICQGNRQ